MAEIIEVPPFHVTCEASKATFRFDQEFFEAGEQYPPNLERMLANVIESHSGKLSECEIEVDLEGLPAISSKQLGAMLAVRKASGREGRIRVLNLRPNVRELLHVTKLDDFFCWD